jgi:hypothetical protein
MRQETLGRIALLLWLNKNYISIFEKRYVPRAKIIALIMIITEKSAGKPSEVAPVREVRRPSTP